MRPRLTYANVVATLALVLALGGGTVYAAIELGKNDVRSRNIAPGAVQLGDLSARALKGMDVDVAGSAKSGPKGAINTDTNVALPLRGKTRWTPGIGEVGALAAEAKFTIASTDPAESCNPAVSLFVNGEPTRAFIDPESDGTSTTLEKAFGRDAAGPFGLLSRKPLKVTAQIRGDADCTIESHLDRLEVRIIQLR